MFEYLKQEDVKVKKQNLKYEAKEKKEFFLINRNAHRVVMYS